MSEVQSLLRLQIWQPCRWNRNYLSANNGRPVESEAFLEQIYQWKSADQVDLYASTTSEATQSLRLLLEDFAPDRPIKQRGIQQLSGVLQTIRGILDGEESLLWSASVQEQELPHQETVNLNVHPLLAFYLHLQWVYDTFCTVPDASITLQ